MWVQFLGWEDPLEECIATHSGILAWRIPLAEEPGGLQLIGLLRVNTTVYALAYTAKIQPDNKSQVFPSLFMTGHVMLHSQKCFLTKLVV